MAKNSTNKSSNSYNLKSYSQDATGKNNASNVTSKNKTSNKSSNKVSDKATSSALDGVSGNVSDCNH